MHKGQISINRVTSNAEPYNYIRIALDDDNGSQIISIELTVENYGKLVSGLSDVDCKYQVTNVDRIGLTKEIRSMTISYPIGIAKNIIYEYYVSRFELDGWLADKDDIGNSKKCKVTGNNIDNIVNFIRYVEKS